MATVRQKIGRRRTGSERLEEVRRPGVRGDLGDELSDPAPAGMKSKCAFSVCVHI